MLAEHKQIRAYVSASSMTDIFYVARKRLSMPVARLAIEQLLGLFEVVGVDGYDLYNALSIPIDDMEDALQVNCARKVEVDVLITRDIESFTGHGIRVIPPDKFTI